MMCLVLPVSAWAQATAAQASSIVFPIAAKTGSFETEVFVRNPNGVSIDIDVLYYEANGLALPGLVPCTFLTIAPGVVASFKLGTQCASLATGSHFGLLVLRDRAAQKTNTFAAFSRVQHVTTNQGFSIEGFPEHVFSGRASGVNGLKRIAAAIPPTTAQPGYQPNCFIGSLGDAVDYTIEVRDGATDTQIGSTLTGSLGPYQLFRYLDILGAAGGPAGDKQNIRVRFDNTSTPTEPAFLAFCTEQDNLSFGADFRIAKSNDSANVTKLLTRCRGTTDAACTLLTAPATFTIPDAITKHRISLFINHPDYIRCDIVGPNAGNLEIRLLAPSPPGSLVGPVVAGGNDVSFFYYETGPRNAVINSNGFQTFWNMEIGPREGGGAPTFPADYGYKCLSGSGMHGQSGFTALTDDF
ncbi:MAG: hypothetical protein ABJC33_08445 [Betaproteobacteria bacterium]